VSGLRDLARHFGGISINGVKWSWDYALNEPVKAEEMPLGSERWKASERARLATSRSQHEGASS
jgi:hypothetical protein